MSRMSCQLYSMVTRDLEMFVMNSEEPLPQACRMGRRRRAVGRRCSRLELGRRK